MTDATPEYELDPDVTTADLDHADGDDDDTPDNDGD